ncbi:uncharacterized protein [Porites lutea]|uniref:uncharacterized protein n=1 Tax=Porites lutea TaxID=51062 RepID=UPI003CC6916A
MEGEDDVADQFLTTPRRPPLRVTLANPRESGIIEFFTAIREGNIDEAKMIYDAKKLDPDVVTTVSIGETGLHLAARAGYLEFVKFLLEAGANVNKKDKKGKAAIHLAASGGHVYVVEVLIKASCTLDDVDKFGRSPLMWATACGHVEVVKLLLKAGASVTTQGNWHALHEACKKGFIELAQLLIDAGAPVNNPRQYSGCTPWSPLHIAVRQGHLDCVKLLIRAGADVNSVNAGKHTPLHEAAYRGYDDIMLELLRQGADPHAASNQKRTPLHEACMQGKVKSAVMLLDVNSKVNARDLVRDTPLHLTLRADHAYDIAVQLTSVLLQYGASTTLLGREDDMPLDIARQTGQGYCLELLQVALEMPQPLTQMCKVRLRKQLACHWDYIPELPLPLTLKRFLQSGF